MPPKRTNPKRPTARHAPRKPKQAERCESHPRQPRSRPLSTAEPSQRRRREQQTAPGFDPRDPDTWPLAMNVAEVGAVARRGETATRSLIRAHQEDPPEGGGLKTVDTGARGSLLVTKASVLRWIGGSS